MAERARQNVWKLPDDLWSRMQLLLPKYSRSPQGGQSRSDLRKVAVGIFYVLRTGCIVRLRWKREDLDEFAQTLFERIIATVGKGPRYKE